MLNFKLFLETPKSAINHAYQDIHEVDVARDALFDIGGIDNFLVWSKNTLIFILNESYKVFFNTNNFPVTSMNLNLTRLKKDITSVTEQFNIRYTVFFSHITYIIDYVSSIKSCQDFSILKNIEVTCESYLANPNHNNAYIKGESKGIITNTTIFFETILDLIQKTQLKEKIKEYCN